MRVLDKGSAELISAVRTGDAAVTVAKELACLPKPQQKKIIKASGAEAVAVIGSAVRAQRLGDRREKRAASAATEKAIFDHFKIDGDRSVGNVRVGEIDRLAETFDVRSRVLRRVKSRFAHVGHSERIRDVVTAQVLSEIIADVLRELEKQAQTVLDAG